MPNRIAFLLKMVAAYLFMFLSISFGASAQQIIKDNKGNYVAVSQKSDSTETGNTYKHTDGKKYKVWKGPRGGLFAWVPNKEGQLMKKYMPRKD